MEVCSQKDFQGLHPVYRPSDPEVASNSWDSEKFLYDKPQQLKSEVEGSPVPPNYGQQPVASPTVEQNGGDKQSSRLSVWARRWWKWLLAIFILTLVLIIGIVAGLLASQKNNSNGAAPPSSDSAGASTSATITNVAPSSTSPADDSRATSSPDTQNKSGAFNGTGIASVWPNNGNDLVWIIYQDYTGDLKYVAMGFDNIWQPSKSLGIKDVMKGTKLTADAYSYDEVMGKWHIVYTDQDGILQNVNFTTQDQTLKPGTLGAQKVKVPTGSSVYTWLGPLNRTEVFAGGENNTIQHLTYDRDTAKWTKGFTFPDLNAYAGLSPESSVPYVPESEGLCLTGISTNGSLQNWKHIAHYNESVEALKSNWVLGRAGPEAHPNSSLMLDGSLSVDRGNYRLLYQKPNGDIYSVNSDRRCFSGDPWPESRDTGLKAMPGTAMNVVYAQFPDEDDTTQHFFMQSEGDDISHFSVVNHQYVFKERVPLD